MDMNGNVSSDQQRALLNVSSDKMNVEFSDEPQLSTLAEQLGIHEIDALSVSQSNRSNASALSKKRNDQPTVVLTQEQVETLIQTLEETGDALKQLNYVGRDLRPRRR